MSNTTTEFTRKAIEALKAEDINTATFILQLLAVMSYEKMDIKKGERYRQKLDTIEADIIHIKELI